MLSSILLCLSLFSTVYCYPNIDNSDIQTPSDSSKFYYFAYGSNLLAKRIHIKNPSAVFFNSGKLANHRLDFNLDSSLWHGAGATIVEDDEAEVWGTLWTLDVDQVHFLDEQESVPEGMYFAKNVTITTPEGTKVLARTYQMTNNPKKLAKGEDLPYERRPSNTYLQVIALGAIESRLPAEYIGFIFSFPTNGKMAAQERRNELGYPY